MKMKATKKIVGAACALVAAVALSAGSTFAWFSSNGTVDATGLEVDVSTNNAYLIIADTAANLSKGWKNISLTEVGKVADTSEGAEEGAKVPVKLLPSAYMTESYEADGSLKLTNNTTLDPSDDKCVTNVGNWHTAQGSSATDGKVEKWAVGDTYPVSDSETKVLKDGDPEVGTPKTTVLSEFTGYVIETNMYVSVAGTVAVENVNMSITDNAWSKTNTAATNNDAISVLILYRTLDVDATADGAATANNTNWKVKEVNAEGNHMLGASADANYLKINDAALSSTQYIEIHVMIYFDGNHTDVNTMNQANLTGVELDFTFTDPATASGT